MRTQKRKSSSPFLAYICNIIKLQERNLNMGFFDLLFGSDDDRNRKAREQEMANMYEFGWDEPEETKCDKKALQREKFANYEYSDEDE